MNKIQNPRLIEAGHFYQKHGITEISLQGLSIMQKIRKLGDKTILFVDDFHNFGDMLDEEKKFFPLKDLDFQEYKTNFDFCVFESHMLSLVPIVEKKIKKKFRIHEYAENSSLFGHKLISSGRPTCLMLDLCLLHEKMSLSFVHHVNILPYFYKTEQQALKQIAQEVFPKIELFIYFFGPNGSMSYL